MPIIVAPAVDSAAHGGGQRTVQQVEFGIGAKVDLASPGLALAGHCARRGEAVFIGGAGRSARVGAEAERDSVPCRGRYFGAGAKAVGRRGALVEDAAKAAARHDDGREIAPLGIAEEVDRPVAATNPAEARIEAVAAVRRARKAKLAAVVEPAGAGLHFAAGQVRDDTGANGAIRVRGGDRRRDPLVCGRGVETRARIGARGNGREAAVPARREDGVSRDRLAAADCDICRRQAKRVGPGAVEFDRTGDSAKPERAARRAAREADRAKLTGANGVERYASEKGIELGHSVEQHQYARCGIAAEPAERGALRGWIGRAAVRSAKGLEAGNVAEDRLDSPAGIEYQSIAIDHHRGECCTPANRRRAPCNDDCRIWARIRKCQRNAQHQRLVLIKRQCVNISRADMG